MAILKGNKKASEIQLKDLNSKAIEKILKYTERKASAQSIADEKQQEIDSIDREIRQLQEEFTQGGDLEIFEEIAELEKKKESIQKMHRMIQDANKKGLALLTITQGDREDLTKTFAPYRKKQDELTAKLVRQIEEMSKTLDDLEVERADYWELYAKISGQAHISTGDIFALSFLKDNPNLLKANGDLGTLVHHNAFPKSFYH